MTLSLAWIRVVGEAHELVFASDSRLSGGQSWDGCPKIFTLPRGDSMVAFAGDTLSAYPLLLQFRNWVELDPRARSRERDITEFKKRMRLMFMDMRKHITDLPHGATKPDPYDCEMLFGGWSWKAGKFLIWRFHWVEKSGQYDFEPVGSYLKISRQFCSLGTGLRRKKHVTALSHYSKSETAFKSRFWTWSRLRFFATSLERENTVTSVGHRSLRRFTDTETLSLLQSSGRLLQSPI